VIGWYVAAFLYVVGGSVVFWALREVAEEDWGRAKRVAWSLSWPVLVILFVAFVSWASTPEKESGQSSSP